MKYRKVFSGLLAGVMVASTVLAAPTTAYSASLEEEYEEEELLLEDDSNLLSDEEEESEEELELENPDEEDTEAAGFYEEDSLDLEDGIQAYSAGEEAQPVKTFSFEGDLDGSTMKAQKRAAYSGSAEYAEGYSGQGIVLGNYGLELNQLNLGETHTVSFWVKRTAAMGNFSSLVFMGSPVGATENWVSVAGEENDGSHLRVWSNGDGFSWSAGITGVELPQDEWTMVTISQDAKNLDFYMNGELAGTMQAARSLVGESNDICIGVNNWDPLFKGVVDEIQIYDQALTADEVYSLYDTRSPEEILGEKEITVADSISIYEKDTANINLKLPAGVTAADAEISYTATDPEIVQISEDGIVTGLKAGTTTITTTVTIGSVTKTGSTSVEVKEPVNAEGVVASYSMEGAEEGVLKDTSGFGNDAAIVNPDGVQFIQDGDRDVMEITDTASYVTIPMGVYEDLSDKEAFTIEAKYSRSAGSGSASWLFNIGSNVKGTGDNYLFYCPSFSSGAIRSGIKNSSTEYLFSTVSTQTPEQYYTVDMVFDHGKVSLYVDGIEIGKALNTNFSMEDIVKAGTSGDILGFIGKSCWSADTNFLGKVDSYKVYNRARTAADIQGSDPAYQTGLQEKLESAVSDAVVLGPKNESFDQVLYNLTLPTALDDLTIAWTTTDETAVDTRGNVYNSSQDKTVTLTATVTTGTLTVSKEFEVTVKQLDLTELNQLLAQVEALDTTLYTEESVAEMNQILETVNTDVKTQSEVDTAIDTVKKAISKLVYKENYEDPWEIIEANAPKEDAKYEIGDTETLFSVPEEVKDAVLVSYASDNETVAVYENGVVKALANGTAIVTVTVEAKSDGFKMEYSTCVTVGEKPQEPEGPTEEEFRQMMPSVDAEVLEDDSVKVTWEKIEGANSYRIYRKEAGGSFTGLMTVGSDVLEFTDDIAVPGTVYYYTVKGFWEADAKGSETKYPTDVMVRVTAGTQEEFQDVMPEVMAKVNSNKSVTVSWKKVPDAMSYRIYRKTAGTAFKGLANVNAGTTSYVDQTAADGVTYYYTVKGFWEENAQGAATKYPSDVKVTIPVDYLKTPVVSTRSINYCTVDVNWTGVTGAQKYVIYRKEAKVGTTFKSIGTVSADTLTYRDATAKMGVSYYYTVKAYAGSVASGYQKTVRGMAVPSSPGLSASGSTKGVTVTWTGSKAGANSFADGYRVFRRTANTSWKTIATVGKDVRSYTDTTGVKGGNYYYTVRAYVKQSDGTTLWGTYNSAGVKGAKK